MAACAMSILSVEDLGISFGGLVAVDGISFAVEPNEIFAVIGPNGGGKTTLFNMISGLYSPGRGRVVLAGEDVTNLAPHELARRGLSRTFQNLQIFFRMSAVENVMVGRHLHERRNVLAHLFTLPSVHAQNRATRSKAAELLALVGLADAADRPASSLAYGALKRLEIARALATEPKVLLLDEAMAGLTPTEIRTAIDLVRQIHGTGITLVIVEHIMEVIVSLASRVIVFHQGREIARGTPQEVTRNDRVIEAYLGKRHAAKLSGGTV
jgi:branched-chain amino acid transport system ATP-binding protein